MDLDWEDFITAASKLRNGFLFSPVCSISWRSYNLCGSVLQWFSYGELFSSKRELLRREVTEIHREDRAQLLSHLRGKPMKAIEVVERFWDLMRTNDFHSVGEVLSDDFVLDWPQSNERIRGRQNFARMNQEYPANGRWQFIINRIIADEGEVVSDVSVTDGVQKARAITFFTIEDGQIVSMLEFWPDPFPAAENRKHLVERMNAKS